jgi:hypothetical protein
MKCFISLKMLSAVALLSTSAFANAQESYTLKMNVNAEGLPPEYAAYAQQDITTYIKGDKLKSERNGMMGTSVTFYDGQKMISVSETMGNKMGFTATKEELNSAEKNEKSEKPKIEYTTEKKMIAGYECSKAIVTVVGKDKKENKSTIWYTDKIMYKHHEAQKAGGRGMMDLSDLKGYPLAMEMNMNQNGMDMKIIMTTTEVLTGPLDDSVFVVNTDGYKMVSYKEMMDKAKLQGQGK